MNATLLVLPGDGIGPDVTAAAAGVLARVAKTFGHTFTTRTQPVGGAAIRAGGSPLPSATLAAAKAADAVLLGAVGDPAFDNRPPGDRPEAALLALRRELGVFANVRPARVWPSLEGASPLKAKVCHGVDLVIVRELTGGLYYGTPRGADSGGATVNTMRYTRDEIERVAHVAFGIARSRRKSLLSVDKANVLEVSQLWRSVVGEVARDYPDVKVSHEYVDAAAMRLALSPSSVDVLLTENLFGDILSDEAGAVCGSLGMLPSASLGKGRGLFEPVHGSAPAIAGRDIANPIGAIGAAAMLLGDGLGLRDEAFAVDRAIERTLAAGLRTADIAVEGDRVVGTREMGDAIAAAIRAS